MTIEVGMLNAGKIHTPGSDPGTGSGENAPLFFKTLPVRIILPVALTIILFILTIFLLMIPLLEKNMMDAKRKGIMHLTESAWSTLNLFHKQSENGELSQKEAQQKAIRHLQQLRYGPELEDYFWINDMGPTMIMHPYRPDLVGKDVAEFKDPSGKYLFVEMVDTVKEKKEGFVDYLWQWKGNTENIVPKISYVKGFEPWGWVIGTGIYVEDVRLEIFVITRQLTYTCTGIMLLFLLVSSYIIWQGAKSERERLRAMEESRLREKQLLQADKMASLGILVAGVAHEVNNPVTTIMLSAPNLKKAWAAFTPVLDDYYRRQEEILVCNMPYKELSRRIGSMLSAIEDSAGRIKKIITELKDFSRPQGPEASADFSQEVDVKDVVKKSLDLTHTILRKATHHLSWDLSNGLPKVLGNPQKLQQVMINLLVNAAQSLKDQNQSIHVAAYCIKEGVVEVMVKDTGPGASDEDLKKLKDPFFTTRRDDGGTGLGLSISDKIVTDHGGSLEFESGPDKGMTARVLLPHISKKETQQPGRA